MKNFKKRKKPTEWAHHYKNNNVDKDILAEEYRKHIKNLKKPVADDYQAFKNFNG
jgi:hypothetical protein